MGELGADHESSLIDVTQMSLARLTNLDDQVFERFVDMHLRMLDSAGDRQWSRDECILN